MTLKQLGQQLDALRASGKDLQYFKDEVARDNGFYSWGDFRRKSHLQQQRKLTDEAAERYAQYREQKAKHAGFIEGCEAQKIVCDLYARLKQEGDESYHHLLPVIHSPSILNCPDAPSPYTLREEGWQACADYIAVGEPAVNPYKQKEENNG